MTPGNLRLLIDCPDHRGLVAAVSNFIALHRGNILASDQFVSPSHGGRFFLRMVIEGQGFGLVDRGEFDAAFAPLARQHGMTWRVSLTDQPKRTALLVSRQGHCLVDLLWRYEEGELDAEIPIVVSNHDTLRPKVEAHGIRFIHLPIDPTDKAAQEAAILQLFDEHRIELAVLARYMQILSPGFLDACPCPVINIHHSFLPAFVGAHPYRQAHARGVKIIGATAHYVTAELDAGPIIHQDVAHVSHRDTVNDLVRIGREVERRVLAQAVRWHLEDRILIDGNRTVVFA
ncbi:MAG: formyltetrahydrofolate deformylase [Isosphaeraceae bacterium]|nr:MAG: formyltetrahydrofolate deformylase [Isosphaeraceae bacterium]